MFSRGINPGTLAVAAALLAVLAVSFAVANRPEDGVPVTHIQTSSDELRAIQQRDAEEPLSEGIGVNGRWTIDVSDSDGEIVDRYVFNNALVDAGAVRLTDVLDRKVLPEYWSIAIGSTTTSQNPCESRGNPVNCLITEGGLLNPNSIFITLQSTAKEGVLTLEGTATARRRGTIDVVSTSLAAKLCGSSFPDSCSDGESVTEQVTSTELRTGIPVNEGQQIDVTVRLSFE